MNKTKKEKDIYRDGFNHAVNLFANMPQSTRNSFFANMNKSVTFKPILAGKRRSKGICAEIKNA